MQLKEALPAPRLCQDYVCWQQRTTMLPAKCQQHAQPPTPLLPHCSRHAASYAYIASILLHCSSCMESRKQTATAHEGQQCSQPCERRGPCLA